MDLLYLHGSTLQAFWSTGKVRFLEALNPGNMFASVHMVNLDPDASENVERTQDRFRFTAFGLARRGEGVGAKLRALHEALKSLSIEERPSLVLADDANLLGLAARWVARSIEVPYAICVYYDNDLHYRLTGRPALAFFRSRRLERLLERFLFGGAVGVYAATRGYRDYALRHGADADRTYLGSWSVDEIFYGAPRPPHPDGRELFFVGRLHPLKFVEDILAALVKLPARLRLDVAGEGTERGRLESLVGSLGLKNRVRFLGLVPREELLGRMRAAKILLITQGFSAAVECVLSGQPVVAFDHECNREVVRDGETGLLVPFRDDEALARAVERLLSDPSFAQGLGQRGRQAMLEECSIEKSIAHRRSFFERCLRT
jgi:glycosyltransferase involved in cell wall biosynthesis